MQRINTLLRTFGIVGFCGLAALALPRPAHAGGVHVAVGFGCPCRFSSPRPRWLSPRSRRSSTPRRPSMSNPRPWSSNNHRSWCNHRWCMDSPTIGATPTTGALGGPGDTTIMTTATMTRMGTTGAAGNDEESCSAWVGRENVSRDTPV